MLPTPPQAVNDAVAAHGPSPEIEALASLPGGDKRVAGDDRPAPMRPHARFAAPTSDGTPTTDAAREAAPGKDGAPRAGHGKPNASLDVVAQAPASKTGNDAPLHVHG